MVEYNQILTILTTLSDIIVVLTRQAQAHKGSFGTNLTSAPLATWVYITRSFEDKGKHTLV